MKMRNNFKLKRKFLFFGLLFVLLTFNFLPVFAAEDSTAPNLPTAPTSAEQTDTIAQKNAQALSTFKKATSNNGLLKFVEAMLGVGVSALLIWLGLMLY